MRKRKLKAKRRTTKPVNWSRALKVALEKENDLDASRVVELIRELHYIVIIKHGTKK
jgi:hypothetical protein